MLKNASLLAKIGADTAENEQHFPEILQKVGNYPTGPPPPVPATGPVAAGPLPPPPGTPLAAAAVSLILMSSLTLQQ